MVKRTLFILPLLATQCTSASHLRRRHRQETRKTSQERQTLSMSDLLGKTSTFISQPSTDSTSSNATDVLNEKTGSNDVALTFESSTTSNSNGSDSNANNIHGVTGSGCRRRGGCKKKNKKRQNTRGSRTQGGENI